MFELPFPFLNSRAQIFLDNFINNPQGKYSSYGGKRESIKNDLAVRYSNILTKFKGVLYNEVYYNDKTKSYFFYFKIPSETFEKLFYDVVLEFQCDDKRYLNASTILDYSMNFFSNSPHMTMTYTYVLHKNKVIVDFLKPKYSKRALTQAPSLRNPVQQFGFEKTCYYAALYIRDKKMYSKQWLDKNAKPFNPASKTKLLNNIMSQDQKFIQYQELKRKADAKKKHERYKKVNAKNIAEYNRVKKEMNKKKSSGFTSVTANHKPFKSLVNKSTSPSKSSNFKSTTANHKPFKSVFDR